MHWQLGSHYLALLWFCRMACVRQLPVTRGGGLVLMFLNGDPPAIRGIRPGEVTLQWDRPFACESSVHSTAVFVRHSTKF